MKYNPKNLTRGLSTYFDKDPLLTNISSMQIRNTQNGSPN
jgi:hypothetical protein